jgi:membrane protease YdiL (CAAX protease family)
LSEGIGFAVTCAATLIMMRIERGRWANYGLTLRNILGRHFWEGALGGFASVSLVLLVIFLLHGFRITGVATHGMTLVWSTLAWCFGMFVVGISEEFGFRGYAQYSLTQGIGFWPAAFVLSALFGVAHMGNNGETMWGLLSVVCFGLLFCLCLRRTGNLWWPIGFHAGWDWGQTFFYGVPDSGMLASHNFLSSAFHGPVWLTGGSVGPEASVFTPLALALAGLLFARRYRAVKYRPETASTAAAPALDVLGEAGGVVA